MPEMTPETKTDAELLSELDELLENVETFGWTDADRDGHTHSENEELPKRARQVVAELCARQARKNAG